MADVVVVGAGPAGLAAAAAAAEGGCSVRLLDDNPAPGGQIWRVSLGKAPATNLAKLLSRLERAKVEFTAGATVFDAPEPGALAVRTQAGRECVRYEKLVIATGARELFLPFPGWTLPGVMGAGGAQALLKSGADFEGRRVVVSGSGPLLLAVGASFARAGADVVGVFELASWRTLAFFTLHALNRDRIIEGARYIIDLGVAPYLSGAWVAEAIGDDRLEAVRLTDGKRCWEEPCDLLACAYGLVPNAELASLLGCEVVRGSVEVDQRQMTSVEGIFAAGEPTGIGGLELALAQGELAGKSAAGISDSRLQAKIERLSDFRFLLERHFALRPEVLQLADADTILCRCEDVRLGEIEPAWCARQAKLYTRIGMGPCQGRVCGPAARALFGWEPDRVRPPLFPTEVKDLAACEGANLP
ncbi:MAG TPA: FAD/NAD(P)-binding oxidoreductase [Fimbriimonadaceae bacterium]|nr:FAD/NAD(P)-binding oxidoreductase [Fimbriimonadaceae bacterium]